jgi:hypothetical protein
MLEIISIGAAGAATIIGFVQSRRFVRTKLRYVDAAHRPATPWLAGAAAALVATPIVAFIPLVGVGTAVLFGAGVGTGVARGSKDAQEGTIV